MFTRVVDSPVCVNKPKLAVVPRHLYLYSMWLSRLHICTISAVFRNFFKGGKIKFSRNKGGQDQLDTKSSE